MFYPIDYSKDVIAGLERALLNAEAISKVEREQRKFYENKATRLQALLDKFADERPVRQGPDLEAALRTIVLLSAKIKGQS